MEKILILGAAGEIAQFLTKRLVEETEFQLVLYGRNVSSRLPYEVSERLAYVNGSFEELDKLVEAMQGVDIVYLNAMEYLPHIETIVKAMQQAGVSRFIGASMAGVEGEVPDPLASWTRANLPLSYINGEIASANFIKSTALDYTLLRLTWLYNDERKAQAYELIPSGVSFVSSEVSRQAVVSAILEILQAEPSKFSRKTVGIGEPNTNFGKPSFYE